MRNPPEFCNNLMLYS